MNRLFSVSCSLCRWAFLAPPVSKDVCDAGMCLWTTTPSQQLLRYKRQKACSINPLATNAGPLACLPSLFMTSEGSVLESSPPPNALENEDTLQIMTDDSSHFLQITFLWRYVALPSSLQKYLLAHPNSMINDKGTYYQSMFFCIAHPKCLNSNK